MASPTPPYPPEYDEPDEHETSASELRAIAYTLLRSGTTVTEVHEMVDEAQKKAREDAAREHWTT